MEPNIDGWTVRDLTIVNTTFFPLYCDLTDIVLKESKTPHLAIQALTDITKNVVDHQLFDAKLDPRVDELAAKKWDFPGAIIDLTEGLLDDDDLHAEDTTRTKAAKKMRVQQILHFLLECMIADMINDAWSTKHLD